MCKLVFISSPILIAKSRMTPFLKNSSLFHTKWKSSSAVSDLLKGVLLLYAMQCHLSVFLSIENPLWREKTQKLFQTTWLEIFLYLFILAHVISAKSVPRTIAFSPNHISRLFVSAWVSKAPIMPLSPGIFSYILSLSIWECHKPQKGLWVPGSALPLQLSNVLYQARVSMR